MNPSHLRPRKTFAMLAVTAMLVAGAGGCSGSDEAGSPLTPSVLDSIGSSPPADVPDFGAAAEPIESAPSAPSPHPLDAVQRYLSGEVGGDLARSYSALSVSSRESVGSAVDWADAAHERPTILSYEIDSASPVPAAGARAVTVTGDVTLEARLDEVSGFVPQRADVEWNVVAEDGGWRLDLVDSSLAPILPGEWGASAAAEVWASARQQCRSDGEYEGSLLGSPELGEQLCGLRGRLVAGTPTPLAEAITPQLVAAFGPDAISWTRTVALSGAADLSVVTAPFGDHWVVVGVTA